MRERICAYCGKPIKGNAEFVEMSVAKRRGRSGSMRKMDLHMRCFKEVWGKVNNDENRTD